VVKKLLLELGLYAPSGKMVVCCPEGFYRRGNVQIVCDRFGIELVDTMEQLMERVIKKLESQRAGERQGVTSGQMNREPATKKATWLIPS
jgi:hypothetical protein